MYEYINGYITELNPAYIVLESSGIGYYISISLFTYSQLSEEKEFQIFIHQVVREDSLLLFGFFDKKERALFRLLISVSGVGSNTARMMLSSLQPSEITNAIANGEVNTLQSIKGIGGKTAQRIIIDLKDKIEIKPEMQEIIMSQGNTIKEESLSALVTLGFAKKTVEKVLDGIFKNNADITVEQAVKLALKKI